MRHRRHVFVCTNTRPEGGKPACAARGGTELTAALQRGVATDPDLVGTVAVTPCGCLGPCFDGPNLVIYPEGEWLAGMSADDAPDLLAYLRGGPPLLERRYVWPDADE
jgi:(2Fe-2S) ferredoxin